MRKAEVGRGREGTLEGITPGGLQGPVHRLRAEKGGQTEEEQGRHRHTKRDSRS